MTHYVKFFKTPTEAYGLSNKQGYGAVFTNIPYSHTKKNYMWEAKKADLSKDFIKENPYCIIWNI